MAPHGTPDWGLVGPKSITYGLDDLAEAAVRLGSIVSYDRRGEVVWADNFEFGGRPYNTTGSGAGNEAYLSADYPYEGALCLVLKTGPGAGDLCEFDRVLRYPVLGGIGLEVAFAPVPAMASFYVTLLLFDGTNVSRYTMAYGHTSGNLFIRDHTGAYVVVGTPGILRDNFGIYSQAKLVVDTLTGHYVRGLLNEHTYDLRAYRVGVTPDATVPSLSATLDAYAGASGAAEVRVDNVIVTQNEPI